MIARLALLALIPLAACTTQPCDAEADRAIGQVAGCVLGGGYSRQNAQLQADLAAAERERADAESAHDTALSNRDQAQAAYYHLQGELDDERVQSLRLESEIAIARGRTQAEQARFVSIQTRLAALRREASAPSEDQAALEQRVASLRQRQRALQNEWDVLKSQQPRE